MFLSNFRVSSPPAQTESPSTEDFLTTVLPRNSSARSSCTKSNHPLGRKRV